MSSFDPLIASQSPAFIQPDIARLLQVFGIDAAQLKSRPDMAAALAAKIYLPLRDVRSISLILPSYRLIC